MAKNNETLTAMVAKQSQSLTGSVPPTTQKNTINSMLERSLPEVKKMLIGSNQDASRFVRIVTSVVKNSKQLSEIAINNPGSIIASMLDIAAYGLDPALPNEVFLVPYKSEAKAQMGYKGLMKLAQRAAIETGTPLTKIGAEIVYTSDNFKHKIEPFVLIHDRDTFSEKGEVRGYYAHAKTTSGQNYFYAMTPDEVLAHQKRFSKAAAYPSSPFHGGKSSPNFDAYALKTVIRGLVKLMPVSNNLLASAIVNDVDEEDDPDFHGAMKITPRESDVEATATPVEQPEPITEKNETSFEEELWPGQ